MKIIYIATSVIPAEKANSYQVMKTCEALTKAEVKVELIIPVRFGSVTLKVDPFEYYGLKERFKIKKIFSLDLIPFKKYIGHLGFWIQNISFAFLTLIYLVFNPVIRRGGRPDIIYSRDRFTLLFLCLFKKNLIYEVHSLPSKFRFYERFLYRQVRAVTVVTEKLKEILAQKLEIEDKILVAPDAVDLEMFNKVKKPREELRKELGLPQDKKLIAYVGQLYTKGKEKGVGDMLRALKILKQGGDKNLVMVFVGDKEPAIEEYKKTAEELGHKKEDYIFIKKVPFTDVPRYEKAFDILVIPFPQEKHYAYYASPLKLFEYMAAEKPIIASDLPSLREVLNQNNAVLVKPDNPEALAEGIKKVLDNPDLAKKISLQAYKDVQRYTWDKRAKKILDFIIGNEGEM